MSNIILYSQISLVLTILLLYLMWKKYGIRTIIHPFSIFLFTWIPSFIVTPIYAKFNNNLFFFDKESVLELYTFFLFNLAAIFIAMMIIPVNAKKTLLKIDFYTPDKLFNWLSVFLLIINIINNVFNKGLNILSNREIETEIGINILKTGTSSISFAIISILNSLLTPLLIISSKYILNKLMYGKNYNLPFYSVIPLTIVVMNTIWGGGRAAISSALITIIVGGMLFYNYQIPLKRLATKGLLFLAISFTLFSAYSSFIAEIRMKNIKGNVRYIFENPKLAFLNGVMEYSFWHIWGYQYRKNDVFTEVPDGLGGNTFGFITNLNIPLSSQIGLNTNIGSLLQIEEVKKAKARGAERITATVYFNLYDDLGYKGAFVAIFIFSLFTQFMFYRIVNQQINHIIALALYMFTYGLWQSSWFHHILGTINLLSVFVPYLIYEILIIYYKKT